VVVISGYPVSIGKLVIVASWLRERSSVIELLSSALVAVASDGSDGTTTEETSSDASPDVVLLSKGSVSTSEVASGMGSDEVGTSD
jgi:C-terminal processing protease CtpA/Prc